MDKIYTWLPFYKELSEWLLGKQNNQPELISKLKEIGITGFRDGTEKGKEITLQEIDPFTFLAYLNKFHSDERSFLLLKVLKVNCKESPFDNIRFDCLPNVVTEVCPLSCRMMSPTSARDVGSIRIRSITERHSLFLLSYTCTPFGFHCCQLTCHFYMTGDIQAYHVPHR